ncbi:5-(carboxyamino)imidazole ribonucleotide mutase [Convivina praedatoris]|uniref:N5-carboxyaminoimidazole ribonucleotide mutase n=1 Tax=Convivina praedatoris TaxID=2880963 RepID=A0ABN8HCV3_9LACO|nr:5-(carboxyamino)imidazole ribonucleotide mutase [Convivina sp. LMG 32447]CAH1851593.1 N5-carboxyaminoimidazole ribonucleotide mutase [Convivina sp. LMG 32447]CAH1853642.1 N5-carboxyaminoimidazole ribonucleotide mutase [Convivina sp. LMG 32447]CAH1854407.1 N5-carboxyaminoimidazole ribonucleotide mutase [Convivina sp. LMG 32447]
MADVGLIMGSKSDWPTMKLAAQQLEALEINYEKHIISAHRMPIELQNYGQDAQSQSVQVIIAGAGGAAHLPGMLAANTTLPVIGVPIQSRALNGLDSLLSIVQMPAGVPVATVAIGQAGATNAALLAAQILALQNPVLLKKLNIKREADRQAAMASEEELK